jgi:hypothetical protein
MTKKEPPAWGGDSLSQFMCDADYNARVTAANYPTVFDLLRRVHDTFKRAEDAVEKDSGWLRLIPRFLLIRTHSSYLAAIRCGMSGQLSEAFIVLRGAVEQAWYALHMAADPDGDRRLQIWLRRNDDEQGTQRCKAEFTVKNVRTTHESLDVASAKEMSFVYAALIDYGAHPNQMGVLTGVRTVESAQQIDYQVGILYPAELPVMATLRLAVAVAVGALKVFQLIYPERYSFVGLDQELRLLVNELNSRFKPYAERGTGPVA